MPLGAEACLPPAALWPVAVAYLVPALHRSRALAVARLLAAAVPAVCRGHESPPGRVHAWGDTLAPPETAMLLPPVSMDLGLLLISIGVVNLWRLRQNG